MSNQDKIDKILEKRNDRFEKVFEKLDKEKLGYLTPKQVKNFWKRRDFDMNLFARIEKRFGLDNEEKHIDLTEFKQIQAIRVLGKFPDDPVSGDEETGMSMSVFKKL